MVEVHGFCDRRFAPIGDQFRAGLESGSDEGASLAIDMKGDLVVDLWGGDRDLARTEPWETDTLVRIASTSKVIVTIAILMLWDRGLVDLDEPVATYWPEFAQNGKSAVTIRQVLVHRAGLPGFGRSITWEDVCDLDRMTALVERAGLWYEPGTLTCYHSGTYGYIVGELVHRVSDLPCAQFVLEQITGPLGADFHYSLSAASDLARVSELWPVVGIEVPPTPMGQRVEDEIAALKQAMHHNDDMEAVIPGGSGVTNARALVRIGSMMALRGEVDGRRYLSQQSVDEAAREQSCDTDQVFGTSLRRGLFFGLDFATFPAPTPSTIHWGGYGGSWVTMDPASGITCAYTPNRLLVGEPWLIRQAAQWQVLRDVLPNLS